MFVGGMLVDENFNICSDKGMKNARKLSVCVCLSMSESNVKRQ